MSEAIQYIDAAAFKREVLGSERPVVVDFYSTECPPCEALAAKFEGLAAVYGHDIKFIKIFRQENRELASELGVASSPTLLFYRKGDRVGEQLSGAVTRGAILRNLEPLLSKERALELRRGIKATHSEADVLVIGAGPAGLTAAIYAAQAKLKTVVVDRALAGGNLAITHRVSNFPGFPEPQPGHLLAHMMTEHARVAGAELRQAIDITSLDLRARRLELDGNDTLEAKHVIVATGSSPRTLGIKGELEYKGKGVSYCATCDAKYYEGKHVVVIGGGNSAVGESLLIAKFAAKITLINQLAGLQANQELQAQVLGNPKFEFIYRHEPREFVPRGSTIGEVLLDDLEGGKKKSVACDGVFVFAGMRPNLDGMEEAFTRDRFGYLEADADMRTSIERVFAAGDVRSKRYRQMTTAVADGTIAAMAVAQELGA